MWHSLFTGRMLYLTPANGVKALEENQRTETNNKHEPHPTFIHHRTLTRRRMVPYMQAFQRLYHSLANWDGCPTPAKSEGIEYLQSWPHRN